MNFLSRYALLDVWWDGKEKTRKDKKKRKRKMGKEGRKGERGFDWGEGGKGIGWDGIGALTRRVCGVKESVSGETWGESLYHSF